MVNGIGGPGMRHTPQDFYKKVDSDGSGGVSQTELQTMAEKLKEKTGSTIDTSDEAFSGYDSDGNGSLSMDELNAIMQNSGFGPPVGMQGPPPASAQLGMDAYNASGTSAGGQDDLGSIVDGLKSLLDKLSASTAADAGSDGETTQASDKRGPDGLFKDADSDASGGVSQDELKVLAQNIQKATGQSLDVSDDAFANYDSNGDGVLSADELKGAMDANGFAPPQGPPPQGPPPGQSQADSSSSMQAQVSELKKLIESLSKYVDNGSTETSSAVSVTT